MTIALITDQHLNGRKGSIIFWEYFLKFYDEVFFPTLQKNNVKTIIDLGDTFDDRKGIDFNVWSRIRQHYFNRIRELGITLHMIIGNHCVYYKNTNKINSPELLLSDYDNIIVYSNPTTTTIEGVPICMLPWINSENEAETYQHLKQTSAKIVMGHLELNGFEVTPGMLHEGGMDPDVFIKFKQVFSGHFHHKSRKGNITYLVILTRCSGMTIKIPEAFISMNRHPTSYLSSKTHTKFSKRFIMMMLILISASIPVSIQTLLLKLS